MKNYNIILVLLFLFINSLFADTIHLKNSETIKGQLLKVSSNMVIIETLSKNGKTIQNISIDRQKIKSIVDEYGLVLFKNDQIQVSDLSQYYKNLNLLQRYRILVKEMDLSQYYKTLNQSFFGDLRKSKKDTIYLINGKKIIGNIIDLKHEILKIESVDKNNKYIIISLGVSKIEKINNQKFLKESWEKYKKKSKEKHRRATVYPQIKIELSMNTIYNKLNELTPILNDLYKNNPTLSQHNLAAKNVSSTFIGIQYSFLWQLTRNWSIGLTGHFINPSNNDSLTVVLTNLRYNHNFGLFRPWIEAGYAWQYVKLVDYYRISIAEDWQLRSIKLEGETSGPVFGVGIDYGYETGFGIFAALRYLLFSKQDISILSGSYNFDFPNKLSQKIDFSIIILSFGLRVSI